MHSWNGKYRRPEGLVSGDSADYQEPMDSELLWVYEGLTEYYGDVLGARSGLRTPELYRENLALYAAAMDNTAGRAWRPLEDTAVAAQLLYDGRPDWASLAPRRRLLHRERADLARGRHDHPAGVGRQEVARRLLRAPSTARPAAAPPVKPYKYEDVIATLNAVAPYDWNGFFETRVRRVAPRAPLGGIENGGWKLVYTDVQPELLRATEEQTKIYDFSWSLGIVVQGEGGVGNAEDGVIRDVVPGLPAAAAGIGPGMRIVAVNGRRYSEKGLREALRAARAGKEPIELIVENVETFKTVKVDYHGGERYPHLERDASKPDLLSAIGKPLAPASAK